MGGERSGGVEGGRGNEEGGDSASTILIPVFGNHSEIGIECSSGGMLVTSLHYSSLSATRT